MLGDDPRPRRRARRTVVGAEPLEDRRPSELGLGVRRVDEDDVERARRRPRRRPASRATSARTIARPARRARSGTRFAAIVAHGAAVALDERRPRGAARQRLDPGGAAAREQVEDRRAAEVGLEDREQRLLDPVGERPGPVARSDERRAPGTCRRSPGRRQPWRTVRLTPRSPARRPRSPASQPASSSWRSGRERRARARPRRRAAPRRAPGVGRQARGARRRWSEATRSRGRPLWARPRTSPSRRSSKSRSASSNPSAFARPPRGAPARSSRSPAAATGPPERGDGTASRDERTVRLDAAAPDPAAELVELGEPEPVGALDDHHRRLGDVDADLDDGRADEHVELAVAEAGHLGVALGGLQPAVDEPDPERRRARRRAAAPPRPRRAHRRRLVVASPRSRGTTTNVRWPSAGLRPHELPQPVDVGRTADRRPDRDPALGRRPQVGHVEVGVEDLAERPRDRRRGHQQHVGRPARRPSPRAGRAARRRSGAARRSTTSAEIGEGDPAPGAGRASRRRRAARPLGDAPRARCASRPRCSDPVSRVTGIPRPLEQVAQRDARAGARAGRSGRAGRPAVRRRAAAASA